MYSPHLQSLHQDGWTAVLCAAFKGHKDVVQELCENFGADFLHRNKVRAMQTVSGSEWLSELCMYSSYHHVWLHLQDGCKLAIVHEVEFSCGSSGCDEMTTVK